MPCFLPIPAAKNAQEYPLNHARIGYKNLIPAAALTFSGSGTGVENLKTPSTYDRLRFSTTGSGTVTATFAAPVMLDYIGIAGHNFATGYIKITVSIDGNTITTIEADGWGERDDPVMILFPRQSVTTIDILIEPQPDPITAELSLPELAVLYAGEALQMQRPIYAGHTPITLSAKTTINPAKSDGGQFLSREIIREGYQTSASFKNLDPAWYRQHFQPFVEHAKTKPFFFAWRPDEYPEEVGYCWTTQDIKPSNSGTRRLMDVSFDMDGHA